MAISDEVKEQYIPTIGIECHVQLKTKTKLFAPIGNDARNAAPNTLISPLCVGMPGALPVLNEKAVELASRAAFALGTEPQRYSIFERKHYFYPDSPLGYQISQLSQPIIANGHIGITVDGKTRRIGINRAQLEADAGKNTHPEGTDYTLVDLNRAGTPLLEIVSEPDIHSAEEAKAYVRELYLRVKYAGVSDADLYHGNMRFDVNVSVSKDPKKLGIRSEVKNLNSFRSVENAVKYELERQIELLEKNEQITQETRGWNDAKQKTFSQRGKEEAHDYRYMPEPDVPPIELSEEYINKVKSQVPQLPDAWRMLLKKFQLDDITIETLLDIEIENDQIRYLELLEPVADWPEVAKVYANWIINILVPAQREAKLSEKAAPNRQAIMEGVYQLLADGKLSSTNARTLLVDLLKHDNLPPILEKYAEEQGYTQVSDESKIEEIVTQIIAENPKAADDVRNGETKAIGFLTGQVMKKSLGKANPGLTQQIIKKQLEI